MSLFGGETIPPAPPASSAVADEESVSPSERSPSPQIAPAPPLPFPEIDDSNDEDFQPNTPDAEAIAHEPSAFNAPSWLRWTAADRKVAASLEDIESADLAAHLYNTHNLKRRLRHPAQQQLEGVKDWQSKDAWLKKGEELQYEDPLTGELEQELIPPKQWSAWPLPPHRLQTNATTRDEAEEGEDGWYIDNSTSRDSGEVMREEVLALFMRTAKKQWRARQDDHQVVNTYDADLKMRSSSPLNEDSDVEMGEETIVEKIRPQSKKKVDAKARQFNSSMYSSETEGEQLAREVGGLEVDTENEQPMSAPDTSGFESGVEAEQSAATLKQLDTGAAVLADDDDARRILEPSINSLLSNIDRLGHLVLLNRRNHAGDRARGRSSSVSDYFTDRETPAPRRAPFSTSQSRVPVRKEHTQLSKVKISTKKSSKRKLREVTSRATDSSSDNCADPREKDIRQYKSNENVRERRAQSTSSISSCSSNASSHSQLRKEIGLMDWSELLGLAAISGWNERVIARTTERCALLFGESMGFRTFGESLATHSVPKLDQYTPSIIPAPEKLNLDSGVVPKRPYFAPGSLRCPHVDCLGSLKDFSGSSRLTEHVRRKHGYDPRTNDSDNEERTIGDVHIDGFLQPIWVKPGWLGYGRTKSEGPELDSKTLRRKRLKMNSRATSAATSAYNTQDEREGEGEPAKRSIFQASETLAGVSQRLKRGKACGNCSRRKKPCDGQRPCSRCLKNGDGDTCRDRELTVPPSSCSNCRRRKQKCDHKLNALGEQQVEDT